MSDNWESDLFERLSEVSDDVYFFEYNCKTKVSHWSENAVCYFGLPPDYTTELLEVWLPLIHPTDRNLYRQDIEQVFRGRRKRHNCRYRVKNVLGEYVWLECRGNLTRDAAGEADRYVGYMMRLSAFYNGNDAVSCPSLPEAIRDITELEADLDALTQENAGPIGILVVGECAPQNRFDANEQLTAMVNVMEGAFPGGLSYQENGSTLVVLARGLCFAEFSEKRKAIRDYIIDNERDSICYGYAWCDNLAELRRQVTVAYTYQQIMENRMNSAAQRRYYALDKLTRIPQMEFFTEFASTVVTNRAWRDSYVFLYFNMDNFKAFNGEYGFEAGDEVLTAFAQLLNTEFPNYVCGRVTSDRFVVLTNEANLLPRLENIHRAVHAMQKNVALEVKTGICRYTPDMTVSAACDNAKIACDTIMGDYSTHYCYYDQQLGEALVRQRYLADNLEAAIRAEHLKVYYQPIVRVLTGNLCAMESLVRWEDPKYGFLNPGEFIPLLEKQGLIHKVDAFVLDRVCRDMNWAEQLGAQIVPVSVNFSRRDFQLCDVYELVQTTVKRYGVDPSRIHIEVTESALNDNAMRLAGIIARFREAGFEVWLDDFGSEYSTLNVLQEYRFDVLKIDMKFLAAMESNPNAKTIIASIVDMAKKLHTRVLAEGVEDATQFEFIKSIGCDKAQGFYMCRPKPLAELKNEMHRVETAEQARYYDDIGRVNCLSPNPIREFNGAARGAQGVAAAIMRYSGGRLSYLFANEDYSDGLCMLGIDTLQRAEQAINDPTRNYRQPMVSLAEKCHLTGECESVDIILLGNRFCIHACEIAATAHSRAYLVVTSNLSGLAEQQKSGNFGTAINFLYSIYGRVDLLDLTADRIETIYLNAEHYQSSVESLTVAEGIDRFAEQEIPFSEDREAFRAFYDPATLRDRVAASDRGYLVKAVRSRYRNNQTALQLYLIIPVTDGQGERYLSCVRDIDEEIGNYYDGMVAQDIHRTAEWYSIACNALDLGVMEWNVPDNRVYVSGACSHYVLGHQSMEELLSHHSSEAFHPDDVQKAKLFLQEVQAGKENDTVTLRMKLIDGGYRACRLALVFHPDENGRPLRVYGVLAGLAPDPKMTA